MNREIKFCNYMRRVDTYLEEMVGVTSIDLPDCDYWDMFDCGITAKGAAEWALVKAGNY